MFAHVLNSAFDAVVSNLEPMYNKDSSREQRRTSQSV